MTPDESPSRSPIQMALAGTLLATEGDALDATTRESSVFLGSDRYVYHVTARFNKGQIRMTIAGKRPVGEYLRWVDGLFRPGEIPAGDHAVHFRAARALRELL